MSRRRNRARSISSHQSQRNTSRPFFNESKLQNSTAMSIYIPQSPRPHSSQMRQRETVYNKNISFFRQNFNPNDVSQLPFMSSLREKQTFKPLLSKTTICFPYEAALKTTCNQVIKKNVSDFECKKSRLAGSYYRWHVGSGRNNRWGVNFECSLRDYQPQSSPERPEFYPYIKPITYNDTQAKSYTLDQMICLRSRKSFLIK